MNVTALIVTWNRLPQLQNTLKATLALPFQHIVVVNNASTDGTGAWLSSVSDTRLRIIHAEKNGGGSEGFFLGSQYIAKQVDTDWVVFYDDDAWPAADFLEKLEHVDTDRSAILCAKVVDCGGNLCKMNLPWIRRTATWKENIAYLKGDTSFVASENCTTDVISCSFVGAVVNAEILRRTYSLIHRELFIYFDDVYYGYYLHLLGYKLSYTPELVMVHDIGNRSNTQVTPWKTYYLVRNMLLARQFFQENSFFTWPAILFRIMKYLLCVCKQPDKRRSILLLTKAIYDGLSNRRAPLDR